MKPSLIHKVYLSFITLFFILCYSAARPELVQATCWNTSQPHEIVGHPAETCFNSGSGGTAVGSAVYSCYNKKIGVDPSTGFDIYEEHCYTHNYACDTTCAGGGAASTCPVECRKTSCGTGYSSASGCGPITPTSPNFGCKSGQACCRKNGSCSVPAPACTVTAPAKPSLSSPADGSTVAASVVLSWTAPTWGSACPDTPLQYVVRIGQDSPSNIAPIATITDGSDANTAPDATSYAYTADAGHTYYWEIVALNRNQSTTSDRRSFIVLAPDQISGTVYNNVVQASCSTTNPQNVGGNLSVSWAGTTQVQDFPPNSDVASNTTSEAYEKSSVVGSNGTYTIQGIDLGTLCQGSFASGRTCRTYPSRGTLTLNGIPSDSTCDLSCGICPARTNILVGTKNENFFLTPVTNREAWWQIEGAGVYAGSLTGESIKSNLPTTSTQLIVGNVTSNVGALIKASSTPPNLGLGTDISDTKWTAISRYLGKRMDYSFFATHMGVTSTTTSDWGSSNDLTQLAYDSSKDFYYMKPPSGTATLSSDWTLANPEKYVVFVDGNLTIAANVTIPVGQFAAFIVKGDIVIDPAATDVAGLYVTDKVFHTAHSSSGDDTPLVMHGSVVTWQGMLMERDLGLSTNASGPAEKFVYRPDLLVNMPDAMKTFSLSWQEVAPGTFGD